MGSTETLTIHEAAEITGWSARMLRYIERAGLVVPPRSGSDYRLYGAAELQRLRTLRELLDAHEVGLAEIGFARRLRTDPGLARDVAGWLDATATRPADVPEDAWLLWEQDKHMRLLHRAEPAPTTSRRPL
ncbi:MAG: MerR family transcriptional regulator [Actinomycetota bacterium]